jgi:hypothetical protein
MPVAVAESRERHRGNERPRCSLEGVRIVSRDVDDAALVEVADNRLAFEDRPDLRILRVLLLQRLKDTQFWELNSSREVEVFGPLALPPINDVASLRSGSRVILLFGQARTIGGPVETIILEAAQCGVVPYSQENLATVRLGIEQDERVPPLDAYDSQTEYRSAFDPPLAPPLQAPPVPDKSFRHR